jgi:hypothetical protein
MAKDVDSDVMAKDVDNVIYSNILGVSAVESFLNDYHNDSTRRLLRAKSLRSIPSNDTRVPRRHFTFFGIKIEALKPLLSLEANLPNPVAFNFIWKE